MWTVHAVVNGPMGLITKFIGYFSAVRVDENLDYFTISKSHQTSTEQKTKEKAQSIQKSRTYITVRKVCFLARLSLVHRPQRRRD